MSGNLTHYFDAVWHDLKVRSHSRCLEVYFEDLVIFAEDVLPIGEDLFDVNCFDFFARRQQVFGLVGYDGRIQGTFSHENLNLFAVWLEVGHVCRVGAVGFNIDC